MMKRTVIVWILTTCLGLSLSAQQKTADTAKIIVDGQISSSKLQEMDGHNILKMVKLVSPQEVGSGRMSITYVVTTKSFAIKQYQQKLSAFSAKYKACIDSLKSDDRKLYYILNGKQLVREDYDTNISFLYNVPKEAIKAVAVIYPGMIHSIGEPLVVISTKKY